MSSRPPSISSVVTAFLIIAVGVFSTTGASPRNGMTVTQDLQKISDAIHELTKAVADHRSYKPVQTIADTLQSQQTTMSQLLSKSVGTSALPPQCQTVDYTELKTKLTSVSQAVEATINEVAHLDQRLQEVEKSQAHLQEEANRKGSCRSPFYQVAGDCLFIDHIHKVSWENARKFCKAFGGDLAVPSSVHKLRDFITIYGVMNFWIGGSDLLLEGDWRWLNGSKVDLSAGWATGEPNNKGGSQNCLCLWGREDLLFDDAGCYDKFSFVCQYTMDTH